MATKHLRAEGDKPLCATRTGLALSESMLTLDILDCGCPKCIWLVVAQIQVQLAQTLKRLQQVEEDTRTVVIKPRG